MAETGGCVCGDIRYEMREAPLFVHCCHCTWCQRETGSAFALNAVIEARHVLVSKGKPEVIVAPSESGNGQTFHRCTTCKLALWSVYSGAGHRFWFLRVGTLDNAGAYPPDIHIYTSTKLPWVALPGDVPCYDAFYRRSEEWPEASLARRKAELARDA